MITFALTPVEPARGPSDRVDPRRSIESLAGGPVEAWSSPAWPLIEPLLCRSRRESSGRFFHDVPCHPFVGAAHAAFDGHRPLELSPDAVWLCIAQGFATHVRLHAEDLRQHFVSFEGKTTLIVIRDDFVKGSPHNDWAATFASFSEQLAARAGPLHGLVVADFSTTDAVARAASEVVLMAAASSYFHFEVHTRCGIPSVTLTGTVDDWRRLRARASSLAPFAAGWWIDALLPVLDQLVATAEGRVDLDFWTSFYHYRNASGGPFVSGWINTLVPYLGRPGRPPERNPSVTDWENARGTHPQYFPSGLTSAPVLWRYIKQELPMNVLAGFVGVGQDPASLTVRPEIGWAVQPRP